MINLYLSYHTKVSLSIKSVNVFTSGKSIFFQPNLLYIYIYNGLCLDEYDYYLGLTFFTEKSEIKLKKL